MRRIALLLLALAGSSLSAFSFFDLAKNSADFTAQVLLPKAHEQWKWDVIDVDQPNFLATLPFPTDFKWAIADSAYQVEGAYYDGKWTRNSWTEWEKVQEGEQPRIMNGQTVGKACERWDRWRDDIALMKECGFQMYRFSTMWSKIEPEEGVFDEAAMRHYVDYVDALIEAGIEPVVCLFHHTWPIWFDQKGAFEHAENNEHFVRYAEYVFKHLHDKVKIWMTFNEPVGYAMSGYFVGSCPPGKKDLAVCGQVVKNFADAHIDCYKVFRAIDADAQIGFPHVIQHLDSYHWWNPVEKAACYVFDYLVNDAILDYFATGQFAWGTPMRTYVSGYNEDAPNCLDYIGVNYYSHTNIRMHPRVSNMVAPSPHDHEVVTDNHQVIYPEGLYRAIAKCAKLGIPMYVAENGVADNFDRFKERFIRQHLFAVSEAIKDGYDVRGYFYWTLMDNWEWNEGYKMKFGLFNVNFDTQERTLYPGAEEFISFVQRKAALAA